MRPLLLLLANGELPPYQQCIFICIGTLVLGQGEVDVTHDHHGNENARQ